MCVYSLYLKDTIKSLVNTFFLLDVLYPVTPGIECNTEEIKGGADFPP